MLSPWDFAVTLRREWVKDQIPRHAAVIAYCAIFSLPSFLLLLIAIGGFFIGDEAIRTAVLANIDQYIGAAPGELLKTTITGLASPERNIVMTIIGVLGLLIGGTAAVRSLQSAFALILESPEDTGGWTSAVLHYGIGIVLVPLTALLLAASLFLQTLLSTAQEQVALVFALPGSALTLLHTTTSFVLLAAALFLLYSFLPPKRFPAVPTLIGSAVASFLFLIGKYLVGLYASIGNIGAAYGVAASLLVLLLWIYFTAHVLLFGAEIVDVASLGAKKRAKTQRKR